MKTTFYKTFFVLTSLFVAFAASGQSAEAAPPKRKEVENFFANATKAYHKEDPKIAMEEARRSMVYCSKYKTMNLIALVKEQEEKREVANGYLDRAIAEATEQGASTDTLYFNKAILANRAQQYDALEEALAQVQATANFQEYWTLKGFAASTSGQKEDAKAAFQARIALAPVVPLPFYNLAILSAQDEPVVAQEMFLKAQKEGIETLECQLGILATEPAKMPQDLKIWSKMDKKALNEYTGTEKFAVEIAKGNAAMEQKDYNAALNYFENAAALRPADYSAHYGMAIAYLGLDKDEKAKARFEKALQLHDFYSGYLGLGFIALKQKQYAEALIAYDASIAAQPENPAALEGKAIALFFSDESMNATAIFDTLTETFRDYRFSYLGLVCYGTIKYRKGEYDVAAMAFEKAIKINDKDVAALNGLSMSYVAMDSHRSALPYFKLLMELRPDDPIILTNYAVALAESFEIEEAKQKFEKALELDPLNDEAANGFAMLLLDKSRYDEAAIYFKRAIAIDETEYKWHVNLGMCYAMQAERGNVSNKDSLFLIALAEHDTARTLGEYLGTYLNNKGVIYAWKAEYETALQHFYQLSYAEKYVNNNTGAVFANVWEGQDVKQAKDFFEESQRIDLEQLKGNPFARFGNRYQAPIKNEKALRMDEDAAKSYIYSYSIYRSAMKEQEFTGTPTLHLPFAFAAPENLLSLDVPLMEYAPNEPCTMLDRKKIKAKQTRLKKEGKKKYYRGQCARF